jgi:PKD repeat protein
MPVIVKRLSSPGRANVSNMPTRLLKLLEFKAMQRSVVSLTVFVFAFLMLGEDVGAQSLCTGATPTEVVDLTGNPEGVYLSAPLQRGGGCCTPNRSNCVQFIVTLDPGAEGLTFEMASGAPGSGATQYSGNCGTPVDVGTQICLSGVGPHVITLCKPGNNTNTYRITSVKAPVVEADITLNEGCFGELVAFGITPASITWRSVGPGAPGTYNSYLNCLSGCDVVQVEAGLNPPPYVDIEACGELVSACTTFVSCDTVRVTINPALSVTVSPAIAFYCANEAGGTLTANPVGGTPPYSYSWSNGATTQSITVPQGSYTVTITDASNSICLAPIQASGSTEALAIPVPAITGTPLICSGASTVLSAASSTAGSGTITGYQWRFNGAPIGGATAVTYSASAVGNYSVTVTNSNGCVATSGNTAVSTATAPTAAISGNGLLCAGGSTTLSAVGSVAGSGTITGYQWNLNGTPIGGATAITYDAMATGNYSVTVTNSNGCPHTSSVITVFDDDVDPTAVCQDITVQLDADGNASITAADIDNGSSDNCAIASLAVNPNTFDCSNVGANTVTLTVTDVNGNISTCDATVTIEDNVDPIAICQDITVQLDADGNASIVAGDIDNGSSDNCAIASLAVSPSTFDCSNVGANTVTLTVTDVNGNSSTCDATVTIEDNVDPIAICQDITVQLDADGNASIVAADIDNGSSDNCAIASLAVNPNTFDCSNVGANTVTLTVTDVNGNVSTCDATVTIEDNVDPIAVCQDITVQLDADGNASIVAADIDNGSSDNCAIASLAVSPSTFDCSNVGANTVTLTVTDVNGNISTCDATVTIEDNIDPIAICQDITVQLDADGNASIVAADIDNGSSDNCAIASLAVNPNTFDCSNVGANTVTLTVTDVNGNVSTCDATVTIEDNVDPIAVCQDITVQLDADGNASIVAGDIDNGSSDNCAIASLAVNPNTFDCSNVGANTVTLTVTDVNGNVSTCDATVTIEDNIDPIALCQDITVQLDADGNASITAADIDNGSSDNCAIASLAVSPSTFDCSNVGANTVTLTVTDVNGNVSTCDATVTIEDNVDPIAVCQDITVQLDADGNASIVAGDIDNGSSDNCAIASLAVNPNTFDCSNVGANTVTLTVTDVNGNSSTCDATVTIDDNVDPTAVCQDITVQLDADGNASITAADIDNGSSDNCAIASLAVNPNTFDCSNVGANTVTLTVTDVNGNISTCDATVTIEDNVDPIAICQDITVQLDADGNASIVAGDIDNGSSDNCAIASLAVSPSTFDCSNVGANTVTLTVTDVNGNSSTCDATVTIEDNVDPIAICQDITVQLDADGNASIVAADIDNGSSDNCAIASLAVNPNTFDCSNVGANTVTLTVTDVNGNVSTCDATVTIEDNVDPIAVCQDITVQLDADGNASIVAGDIDNGSSDNCAIASLAVSPSTFDCSNVGANTVTLTVTDVNGNSSTCDATVTIDDNVDPTAVCQDITVQLDADGNASITAADIDNGSSDNCAIASLAVNPNTFDCSNVGANTVTLTVTDVNGNISTCDATVTIEDNVDPIAICQDITVQLDADGNASIVAGDIDNGSSDNCAIASLAVSPSTFDCSNVGANTVTLTVTDVNGNSSTCDATVTIEDNVDPIAICQDITVQLDADGNASIVAADIDNGSSDNCAIASLAVNPNTFDCSNVGANTVTLTVTDVNGNVSTCDATVTIEDNVDPIAVCQDITVQLDADGNASIVAGDIDNGSSDNCAIASLAVNPNTFDCSNVGANTVTLTVTDVNGNVSTCDATVTIEDNIDPIALCQDITVQLDADGNASIVAADIDNGSSDNCAIASLAVNPNTFDCSNVGANTVTLTVTDVNGNISTCDATVTIEDNVDPIAICQDITVQLDADGNASIVAADIDNGSSDNCAIASLSVNPSTFDCSNVGTNTVTLTVTDVNGNVSTCDATVTIEDNVDPIAVCQDITVQLDADGNASIVAADIDNGSSDNCAIASLAVNPNTFDCSNVGANTVTLTVTDVNGNSSTCDATVTIDDNVDPTAVCQDITVQLDADGNASITAADIDNGSSDNCAIASLAVNPNTFDCSNVGANTVTLTVTDVNGNVSTCDATVTIEDNIDPIAVCQDITVQLDADGNASIVAADIDNGSSDNCAIASLAVNPSTFDCSNVGANTVTLTVTDVNGNVSTCDATVTIEDNIDPIALCQDITVQLDADGNASITAADIDNGSSDNCAIASLAVNPNTFDCSNVGANTVTLTVTDVNGNSSTCDATVTIDDNVDPTAVCQDITVQLDADGNASITAADIDNGSSDNCAIASLAVNPNTFDCSNVGANTVTLTVTDVNGNVSTCDATVTIEDNIDPIAVCQDITVQLDADGNASIVAADIDNGSSDNCAIASLAVNPSTFDCSNVGANTVTLTVTDVNGNISTCDATVTIEDNIDPIAICQDITVQLDADGNASITAADIDNGSSDNCAIASLAVSPSTFDCSNVGANTVTLTVTDVNGNVSTCDATVTIEDNIDPIAICQDITVQLDADGNASITAADIDNGSSDNCAIASLAVNPNTFDCSNVGANTVTLTVTDVNGNVSTCDATVTIEDNIDPIAVCQDITVQLDADGNASIVAADIDNGSSDNCAIASLSVNPSTFDCSNVGTNTVTLTVTDVNGNVSTCDATVTIEDNVDPIAICQDITVQLDADGNASIVAADIDNGSSDNCAIASLSVNPSTFDCSNVGANTVTLTVSDVNGNISTCDATVTIEDNVDPIAVCQDITVQLDADGNASITAADIDNGSSDNCAIASLAVNPNTFDCSNVGANTVTLTVTDVNGNISTCDATVTIEDNVDPIAICQDITVQLDADGNASITAADIDNGSSDNCAIASLAVNPSTFDCSNVGANTVTLTVTDVNGNISTCDATVTIEDNIDPIAICQDITVQLDADGNASITAADIDNGSSDNCAIASLAVNPNTFDCSNVGANTVTLTVTDVNGNVSTCDATVTIEDNIDPIAICQDITVQLDADGNASIVAADIDNGSSDNCAIASLSVNPSTFDCSNVGANTVTLTVTDVNGNISTCDATVTIEDNVDPIAVCQDITVQLDADGNASIVAADIDNGSSDNCAIASLAVNPNTFDCSNVGANTVTLTVTDVNGNVSTCDATVTIEDNIDPIAICQDITVQLDADGNASIVAADIDNGSSDNCAIASLSVNPSTFDCSNVGANTVTLTVTDVNGNVSTCDATVTIEDNIDPIAVCQDITVQLDADGNASITAADIDNGSSDNCAIASLAVNPSTFDCSNVGANTVTLTVTDVNGNISTCDATVTIEDNIDPIAICQDITVQLDADGNASITAADIDNGSSDNCAIASLSVNPSTFDCSNVGANTVTLTVTDVNGNVSTCDATVTIEDNIDPIAICQDITVQLDADGNASITAADIDNGSSDNCAIASLSVNPSTFDCSNVGANTVTLTVTDVNGNVSTCDATVTIEDNIDPIALCQDITVQLDADGNASITAADIDNGSSDNCAIASLAVNPNTFDCSNVGANTVTLTVTDVNGNVSTCDATVTIEDNIDPIAVCQDITVQLDADGNASITAADIDNGSSDNCAIASLAVNPSTFDCSNVGANTVTLTVTDVNGNISTCDATVTIEDNVDPIALCQDITVQLDANGEVTITAADIDNGSFDNCGAVTLTIDGGANDQTFDCTSVGVQTVTLTVTDANGNTSTCDASVTIEDNVAPTAICQDITVQLDANGEVVITAADIDNGSFDNCGTVTLTIDGGASDQTFDCSSVGVQTVTLTVTDANGNTSTCDADVTIEDNVAPTAICQDITVQLDANGEVVITAADIDNGSFDNCGTVTLTIDGGANDQTFDCTSVGVQTVTLTVTDANGNTSTCDAQVTIEDNVAPTAICQDITVQLDANGEVVITATDIDNGSFDNCGTVTLTIDGGANDQTFDCSSVGTQTVTLTVTDANGNTSTCDAQVTIEDNVAPTAICQDITVQLDANGEVVITAADIDNGSFDNCGTVTLTINGGANDQTFDCSSVGAQTVTLTVTDANGNVSTCDAQVTIEDNVAPTAICQDITVQLDANGEVVITAADIDNGSFDNCGTVTLTIDGGANDQTFDCTSVGTQTVTLTVTDANGNSSTCDAQVTIEDNVAPTAICQDITVQLDANGEVTITAADIDNGSFDNCGTVTLTIDGGAADQTFDCTSVGTQTVTLTVTDANGNTSTCDAQVTIEDNMAPTAICQDITVQLDANGEVTITAADIDNGSFDNCGSVTLTVNGGANDQTFDCTSVGTQTVTLTVTDAKGNSSTCDAQVTIEDNVAPTAICQDITVQLDANGEVVITAADIDNGSFDNCGTVTLTIDGGANDQTFDCSSVGTQTVTLTVTDANGNVSTCDAQVTIEDNVAPTAICQDITVQLDANGEVVITAADIDNGSFDNCGTVTLTIDGGANDQTFDCTSVGVQTITLTVTDANGNTSTCDAQVTIEDNVAPTAICQDITVQLDANGEVVITAADIDNGSFDNCGTVTLTIDGGANDQTFDCSSVGTQTVTLTVTDANGNVSTCDAQVTIEDNVAPTAICQDITVQLDANGEVVITAADIDNGSFDNCGTVTLTIDGGANDQTFDCTSVGVQTITLTVTDANGNTSTCDAQVTIEDNVAPTAICQDITVQLDANGEVTITAADIDNGSFDNCGTVTLTIDGGANDQTFDCTSVGVQTVTLTVTDANGNVSTCDAQVTIEDNVAPTAICQDITVQLDANGEVVITAADIDNGSFDNCGTVTLTIDGGANDQTFDCSSVGTQTVTLTVTDANGNTSTCDAQVTIEDNVAPTAICQDITVQLDANGEVVITAADIDNGSFDNCGAVTLTINGGASDQTFDCTSVGVQTVTLTVTDANGNTSTCDAQVTIEDNVAPTAICQDITVQLDANGEVVITAADIDNGSFDNCGSVTLTIDGGASDQTFDCTSVGTQTVTLTVTDTNGNTSTCDASVTIEDNVAPTAICQDITVQLDNNGEVVITAADIDNGSFDNCGTVTLTVNGGANDQTFDCTSVGTQTVTLTVTDTNGNTSTCDASVTIEDNVAPTAICQDITVQLDANGEVVITAADIDNGSFDNCGTVTLTIDGGANDQTFDCTSVGVQTVTLTVTDANGNTSTCDAQVTIEDNVAPTAICQDITVQLDANGEVTITAADIDNGSFDNCGDVTLTLDGGASELTFECASAGTQTVTLTVTDQSGNTSTCDASVTVVDNVSPTVICQDITIQLDADGNATLTAADIDNGSFDNCGIASITLDGGASELTFDCASVGTQTVTLTVTDDSGNSSSCDAIVTIEDNIAPTAICQDITVQLDANGEVVITAADIDNGSFDNCGAVTLTINGVTTEQTFDCTSVGVQTVTLTVTDANGNTSTCEATVTVEDAIAPTAVCQDITVQLDANGEAVISAAQIDNGSFDNCGAVTLTIGGAAEQTFDCSSVGTQTIILTVTDANGNVSTCDAQVTIEDNVAPTAICQDITVQLDANGEVVITAADIDNGSFDNCGVVTLSINGGASDQTFDCTSVGVQTITLTVTDANGNVSTCDATVTIEDNIAPTAICQDITVQLDANGEVVITAADIDNGSFDNCGNVTLTVQGANELTLGCESVGVNTITLIVTDANGNSSTCDATVTVVDDIFPTAICNDITIQLNEDGEAVITAADIDNGSFDNCGNVILTLTGGFDQLTFDCSTVGVNTVTLNVIDQSGNISTCEASVTVEGSTASAPTALCQDITVYLGANGTATISSNDIDNGSFAACGIGSIIISQENFNCNDVGENEVSLVVTDGIGQTDTCFATVTVLDTIGPVFLTCPTDIVIITESDNCEAVVTWDIPTASDNCNAVVVSPFQPGATFPVGTTTITYIATDPSENTATCTFTVTVQPSALTAAITLSEGPCGFNLSCNGANDAEATVTVEGGCEPYTFLWSNSGTDQTVTDLPAGSITVTVTDANGTSVTATATVTAPETVTVAGITPSVFEGGVNVSCQGATDGSLTANITGGSDCETYTFAWSGPDGFTSSEQNISGLGAGTYTLTVTDASGCAASQSVTLTAPSGMDLQQMTVTDAICKGSEDGQALVVVTGGTPPYSYLWPETNQITQLATGLGAGENIVVVTDANGCVYTDTALVGEPESLMALAFGDTSICPGSPVIIGASAEGGNGQFIFTWNQGLGTGASQTVSPMQTTVYTVSVTDVNGCEGNDASVTVSVFNAPSVSFTYEADDPCEMPVTVAFSNTTQGATTFEWLILGETYTEENPVVTFPQPGNYAATLIASSGEGCTASVTQQVVVSPVPTASFNVSGAEGCYPLTVTFGNQSSGAFSYQWDFGNGNTSTSPNPSQTYWNPGSYDVTLIVTSQSGCTDTLDLNAAVTVYQRPIADFTVIEPENAAMDGTYSFQNNSVLADAYNWNFDDGTQSSEFEPTHEFNTYGGYFVTLTAINEFGCADTAVHYINVEAQVSLFVPNAMAPGQGGLVAVWQPTGRGIATYGAQIFDKWGNMLWESDRVVNGEPVDSWDGTYRGKPVPQGSYIWNVQATFVNGQDWQGMEGNDGIRRTVGSVTVLY